MGLITTGSLPNNLRKAFDRPEAAAVFSFQLRNPVHNEHAQLMNDRGWRLLEMGYHNSTAESFHKDGYDCLFGFRRQQADLQMVNISIYCLY